MKHTVIFFLLLFLFSGSYSQSINGYITDATSGEKLAYATVYNPQTQQGVVADINGYFSLKVKLPALIVAQSLGYKADSLVIKQIPNEIITFKLEPAQLQINGVEIKGEQSNYSFLQGRHTLPIEQLKRIPSIGGEKDVIRALATQPGVNGGADGFSAMSVRGGSTDQNLFLVDGVQMYNTGHLFNFVSVFNPEAIKNVNFYKNMFPARFGGHLSSITEITLRDGNRYKPEIKADIGLINSKLTIEGPIGKIGKTSYIIAARSTYLDLFRLGKKSRLQDFVPGKIYDRESFIGYTFADCNFKLSHWFNDKNSLHLSIYEGIDRFNTIQNMLTNSSSSKLNRNNLLVVLKSKNIINSKFISESAVTFNFHSNFLKTNDESYELLWVSFDSIKRQWVAEYPLNWKMGSREKTYMKSMGLSNQYTYNLNNTSSFHFGFNYQHETYYTGDYYDYFADSTGIEEIKNFKNPKISSDELALFADNENIFFKKLQFNIGLRLTGFMSKDYVQINPEPRLLLGYKTKNTGDFSLTATRMVQNKHALMRNEQLMQMTVWVPSSKENPSESAWQYALAYRYQFKNKPLLFEADVYYKQLKNQVYYDAAIIDQFQYYNWQEKIISGGIGKGYGAEFSLIKTEGKFTGMINYTYSDHKRQYKKVNNGRWFNYKYNRTHVGNISVDYALNDKWKIGAFWTISSGIYFTVPDGRVEPNPFFPSYDYFTYSGINNRRLPVYHRLDLNACWTKKLKKDKEVAINFNIYNAYDRQNSVYVYIDKDYTMDMNGNISNVKYNAKSKSYMPIIPSVNISYKFK